MKKIYQNYYFTNKLIALLLITIFLMGIIPLNQTFAEPDDSETIIIIEEETTNPTEEPIHPSEEPTDPTEETTEPIKETTEPIEETTNPTEETIDPTEETTDEPEEPIDPTDETDETEETEEEEDESEEDEEELIAPPEELVGSISGFIWIDDSEDGLYDEWEQILEDCPVLPYLTDDLEMYMQSGAGDTENRGTS